MNSYDFDRFPSLIESGNVIGLEIYPEKNLYNGPVFIPKIDICRISTKFKIFSTTSILTVNRIILYPRRGDGLYCIKGKNEDLSWWDDNKFTDYKEIEDVYVDGRDCKARLSDIEVRIPSTNTNAIMLIRVPEVVVYFKNDNTRKYFFRTNQDIIDFIYQLINFGYLEEKKDVFFIDNENSGYTKFVNTIDLKKYIEDKIKNSVI